MQNLPHNRGERITITATTGATATISRATHSRAYVLRRDGCRDHCRFGDAGEIRQDVAHFLQCGHLPIGERF